MILNKVCMKGGYEKQDIHIDFRIIELKKI